MDESNIIELIDENNETVLFEHVMTLDYDGQEYVILSPGDSEENSDEGEIVILRVEQDDDGQDVYLTIEDEDELDDVYSAFNQIIDEQN